MLNFDQVYTETNRRRVLNVCHRILRNMPDAEDATQDTFLRAFTHLDSFRGESSVSTWLCEIAHNLAMNYIRHNNVLEMISLNHPVTIKGDDPSALADLLPAADPSPEWYVFLHEAMEAMNTLCPQFREPLELRIQGLTMEEIGVTMGMLSVVCIRTRVVRAQRQMRKEMGRGKRRARA